MIMEDKNTDIIRIDTPQTNYELVEGHDQIGWDEKFIDTETIKNCRRCGAKYDIDKDTWTFTTIKAPKQTNVVHETADHKWGQHMYLFNNNFVMIKLLQIEANQETEYVYHQNHDEYIIIASGKANILLDDKELVLNCGDSIKISREQKHKIKNDTKEKLLIVEHWLNGEFDHDDQVLVK
jgi:mannose-6-phosphate isomerase-like protein (cupin superfamily)